MEGGPGDPCFSLAGNMKPKLATDSSLGCPLLGCRLFKSGAQVVLVMSIDVQVVSAVRNKMLMLLAPFLRRFDYNRKPEQVGLPASQTGENCCM